jgi:2-oxoglutarate ferredoxin oxidoreductase subunit alpha
MYNILIGGAAGQGIDTTAAILEKLLKRSGYSVFVSMDFMSRIRGGHNFALIRFGTEVIMSHSDKLDGIIALNNETVELHLNELKQEGFILCDSAITSNDPRTIKINMSEIAKSLGNPRVSGSVAVGAIIKLFSNSIELVDDIMKSSVKQEFIEINIKAAAEGYNIVESKFPHLSGNFKDWMIISGNKALSLGSIAAGLKFYCAYPMSPSTSILEFLASKSDEAGIVVEQAEDEIAAINMAIGASYAGACAMTGTSGGGFSLMVEGLGLSSMTETPLVVVDCQRPGPTTGFPTRTEQADLKFVISASQGEFPRMVIALRNHTDAFYQTIRAFKLAEKYQIPVIILTDEYLCDASATVKPFDMKNVEPVKNTEANKTDEEYLRYRFTEDGISPRLIPGKSKNFVSADSDEHDEWGRITESAEIRIKMVDKRMKKLENLKLELQEPEFIGPESFEILLIGWGSTYGSICEAVKILNENDNNKYAALIFGDIYPLPKKLLKEKVSSAKQIINIEQNSTGQLASLIREQTGIVCSSSILKYDGRQISVDEIVDRINKGAQL